MINAREYEFTANELFEQLSREHTTADPLILEQIADHITIKGDNTEWEVKSLAMSHFNFVLIGERKVSVD